MCSLGGAVGGVLVGLVAPHIFTRYSELPIAMVWCAFLTHVVLELDPPSRFRKLQWNPLWLASLAGTIALAYYLAPDAGASRLAVRNFYGSLDVSDFGGVRKLTNGIINHGEQILDPGGRTQPTTYYGPKSGVGLTLLETEHLPNRRVGIIGLGAGTLAAYGQMGDYFRFYDINPLVLRAAKTEFTYLQDSKARIDLVPGDARSSLERERKQDFDVLVVDAFAGDAIPVHLLTLEAFALYFRHLKETGILAVHVSNLYLDLTPIVQVAADSLGKRAAIIESPSEQEHHISMAAWMLVGRSEFFERPSLQKAAGTIRARDRIRPWTDDYNDVFQVLR
jgi:SAM-dependent methyltransferase